LISQHTIGLELALPVQGFPLTRSWFVVQRRSLPLLPVQRRLRDFLLEHGQSIIEEISRGHVARSKLSPRADRQGSAV
jgi:hypothetical protein